MPVMTSKSHSIESQSGLSFISLVFLMVFAAWGLASAWVLVSPGLRTGGEAQTQRQFKKLQAAITQYRSHAVGGAWPSDLSALLTKPLAASNCSMNTATRALQNWCGPYIDVIYLGDSVSYTLDGFGKPIVYDSGAHTLTSFGNDRASGGGDDLVFTL